MPEWFVTLCLGLVLLVALIPVYRLAFYAFPYYDDYNYGINVKYTFEHGGNIIDILKSAKMSTDIVYNTWQGTYASVFLMSLMPAAFGFEYYYIGIFAIITMLVLGSFYLTYTVAKCIFKASSVRALNLGLFVTFMNLELFHEAQQGIYWYNSSIHYTFMHSLMFVLLAEVIRCIYSKEFVSSMSHMLLSAVLAYIVAGANFVTALQGILIILFVFFVGLIVIKKRALYALFPIGIYLVGMIYNMTAPGNEVRQASYAGVAKGPIEAIYLSFGSAFKNLGNFTGFPFWALLLALLPICFAVGYNCDFKFPLPGLVSVLSFCYYATGFTPSWYGMGHEGLARTFCAIKLVFIILIAFNLVYWLGWITHKLPLDKRTNPEKIFGHMPIIYVLSIALFVVSFIVSKNQAGNYLSYGAYYYTHTGEALNFYNEHLALDEFLKESGEEVVVEPLVWRPWFLTKSDEIEVYPEAEQNKALAKWYDKTAVYASHY